MGYYTRYEVEIISGELPKFEQEMIARGFTTLEKLISFEVTGDQKSQLFGGENKWYDHERDMEKVSRRFPDAIFRIEGNGEEQGDVWKAYFKNGKSVKIHPETTWPAFKESMLE